MRAVIQRVKDAAVYIEGKEHSKILQGLLVLMCVMQNDNEDNAELLAKKVCELRIFEDENNKMNKSIIDIGGEALVVSQFTLAADCSHGRRPSFVQAARPEIAVPLYELFIEKTENILGKKVHCGVFGADMQIKLLNDGPVTILLDTAEIGGY